MEDSKKYFQLVMYRIECGFWWFMKPFVI